MRGRELEQRVVRAALHARREAVPVREVVQNGGGARHVRVQVARGAEVLVQPGRDEVVVPEARHRVVALHLQRPAAGRRPHRARPALRTQSRHCSRTVDDHHRPVVLPPKQVRSNVWQSNIILMQSTHYGKARRMRSNLNHTFLYHFAG